MMIAIQYPNPQPLIPKPDKELKLPLGGERLLVRQKAVHWHRILDPLLDVCVCGWCVCVCGFACMHGRMYVCV